MQTSLHHLHRLNTRKFSLYLREYTLKSDFGLTFYLRMRANLIRYQCRATVDESSFGLTEQANLELESFSFLKEIIINIE